MELFVRCRCRLPPGALGEPGMKGHKPMTRRIAVVALLLLSLTAARSASAQLLAAADGPIVYGHHHFNTTNMAAQKKFFVDTLGGTLSTFGPNKQEIVTFPNVLLF